MRDEHAPLVVAALALALLPFALDLVGLTLRSAVDVVVFAIACMGLNVLLGHTGLVSFGHGAWFGLAAYAAALSQRHWFPGAIVLPFLFAIVFVAAGALLSGALILRRRGVYFSLLTLALTALLFAIGYPWTELTGGESGLGGVTRATVQPRSRIRPRLLLGRRGNRHGGVLPALALPPIAGRQRAGGDPRERGARTLRRLSHQPLQADRLRAVRDRGRHRRHTIGVQSPLCVGGAARGGVLGRAGCDGGDWGDAELSRPRPRCVVLHPLSRVPVDLDAALAVLFWSVVRRLHRILADRFSRRCRADPCAVPQADDRGRGNGRAPNHRDGGTAASLSPLQRERGARAGRARSRQAIRRHSRRRRHRPDGTGPHVARADRPERRRQDDSLQSRVGALSTGRRHDRARRPLDRRLEAGGHHRGRRRPLVPDHKSVRRALGRGEPAARRAGAQRQALRAVDVGRRGGGRERGDGGACRLSRPRRHRTGGSSLAFLWRAAPARHGARHCDPAANPAARRAARRARRRRARAHRRAPDDDRRRNSRAAGRTRHRPRLPDRRPRHGHERGQGAG